MVTIRLADFEPPVLSLTGLQRLFDLEPSICVRARFCACLLLCNFVMASRGSPKLPFDGRVVQLCPILQQGTGSLCPVPGFDPNQQPAFFDVLFSLLRQGIIRF